MITNSFFRLRTSGIIYLMAAPLYLLNYFFDGHPSLMISVVIMVATGFALGLILGMIKNKSRSIK